MELEYVIEALEVFLESNTFVRISDEALRKKMVKAFGGHCVNGWDMKQKAEAILAERAAQP